jgi:integrase
VKGKGLVYGTTTNGKVRVVNLPSFLCDALAAYLTVHPSRSLPLPLDPDELVFRSPRGAALRHTAFYERVFKPAVISSLPRHKHGLRFHDLRHTCASLLINPPISANALTVAEHLGHSDPSITLRVYSHLFKGWEVEMTSGLDAIYTRASHAPWSHPLEPKVDRRLVLSRMVGPSSAVWLPPTRTTKGNNIDGSPNVRTVGVSHR